MLNVSLPDLLEMDVQLYLSANLGYLNTQMLNFPKYMDKRRKKEKPHWKKAWQGHIKHVVQFFEVYLPNTVWTLDSEGIWGIMLQPAFIIN